MSFVDPVQKKQPIKYDFTQDKSECGFHIKKSQCTPSDVLSKILKDLGEESLESLKEKLQCVTELCVIENNRVSDVLGRSQQQQIIKSFFKVKGPEKKSAWLSNFDIDDVLDQIEKKYPEFLHINFHMRDFTSQVDHQLNLTNLNIKEQMAAGKLQFGVVFNTDYSTGNGIHWFAIFGDFKHKPYTIEYFNSSGEEPLPEIEKWMLDAAAKWSHELNTPVNPVIVSKVMYQQNNFACGTYSLYYIMSRLAGTDVSQFTNDRNTINDSVMDAFRRYMYR
jgi:hypothetical protein